jgi:hypothetical protein
MIKISNDKLVDTPFVPKYFSYINNKINKKLKVSNISKSNF